MEKYIPKMYKSIMNIYKELGGEKEEEVIKEEYELIEGISVDFGILQKTRKAYVIKSNLAWDDIGSFTALARFIESYRGNNISGKTFLKNTENCSIFGREKLIIGFGIKDLVIVDANDVILIMDKSKDQEIKSLINELKESKDFKGFL